MTKTPHDRMDKLPPGIDWETIHRRLENTRQRLEAAVSLPDEERKSILHERAKAMARESKASVADQDQMEILEFVLASEKYGLESSWVEEVYPLKEFTPVPCTPPFVLGVMNLRGRVLSVIDIKKFFDLPEKGLTELNKVIVLKGDGQIFGILADAIEGIRSVRLSELQTSLPTLTGIREEYLKGVTRERVVVLDALKLLTSTDIFVEEETKA